MGFIDEKKLADTIHQTIADKLSSDAITQKIEETLDKTVSEAVNEALRSYSTVGKAITKAIEESLQIDSAIGIPSYNETVKRIVKQMVENNVDAIVQKQLLPELEEMFQPAPEEITIEELMEKFAESTYQYQDEGGVRLKIDYETDGKYHHFFFQEDSDSTASTYSLSHSKWSMRYRIDIDRDGHVYGMRVDEVDVSKKRAFMLGRHFGFDRLMVNIYANKTKVIVGDYPDDIPTEYGPRFG